MAKRKRVPRKPGEIHERLRRQYRYLTRSATFFDSGAEDEAERLAGACRVLFSDTGGTSLITQLHARHSFKLPDTAVLDVMGMHVGIPMKLHAVDEHGNEVTPQFAAGGLIEIVDTPKGPRWGAPLDARMHDARWLPLDRWLSEPVVRDSTGITHSRDDFIRVLRNQEGGSHVDPTIEEDYARLRDDTLGALSDAGEGWQPPALNVVEASMRQIAHEAIRAVEQQLSPILSS
jgi:hypothetical protein